MSKGAFDDNNLAQVAYTGSWASITRSGPHENTLHSTTQSGASATVSFTGNLGRVFGTVPRCTSSPGSVVVTVFLDDSMVLAISRPCAEMDQDGVLFYDSGTLLGGNQRHKLSVVNQGSDLAFQLDMFVTASGPDTGSPTTVAQTGLTPTPTTSSTTTGGSSTAASSSGSESSTTSLAPSISITSDKSLAAGAAASSSMQIVTIDGVVTSMMVVPTSPTGPSVPPGHPSSSPLPIGLIVGSIIGFLLIILLLIFLYTRCRRRRNTTHSSTHRPLSVSEAVTPFQVVQGTINPLLRDLEVAQKNKIDQSEDSSPPAPREPDEKRPPEQPPPSSDPPSSESQSSTRRASLVPQAPLPRRPISTISSVPSEAAPAYHPRYRSAMSTLFNFNLQSPHVGESPPSYDSVRNGHSSSRS